MRKTTATVMRYQQRMKYLTGISLETWMRVGMIAAFALLYYAFYLRGNEVEALRSSLAGERASHAVTRASVSALSAEIGQQNAEIERQRADIDRARRDLAQAVEASAGSADLIDRLRASSRVKPDGVCLPSATARSIWP